jgi:hypothetical protein
VADDVTRRSLEVWASNVIEHRVPVILREGHLRTALVQTREALRCSRSPRVLRLLVPLLPRIAARAATRAATRAA